MYGRYFNNCRFFTAVLFLFYFSSLTGSPSRDFRGDQTVNYFTRYTDITLESKKVHYLAGEDVEVGFRIKNRGYQVIRIYPSLKANRTFQFMVTDKSGRELELEERPVFRENGIQKVVNLQGEPVKEIILHPGESYEKRIFLNDLYPLKNGTEYKISGYFYPDSSHELFYRSSNTLKIRIEKDKRDVYLASRETMNSVPRTVELTPEETVFLFLSAEIKKKWPNYLKYLQLNKYITSYDRFASRYAAASDMEKPDIMRQFTEYLSGTRDDILKKFDVTGVNFERDSSGRILENGRAMVTVHAERDTRGYIERYEYIYSLERSDSSDKFWQIIYVTARVL